MRKSGAKRKAIDPMASIRCRTGLTKEELSKLGIRYHSSLMAYMFGKGNDVHFGTLAVSTKLSAALCKHNVKMADLDAVYAAQLALLHMHEAGRTGFTGDELQEMRAFSLIHDEHLRIAPVGLIETCLYEIYEELK
jgi:hypothetical protein